MPEEYEDVTERARELIEERHHPERGEAPAARPRWMDWLAVSTALFAVLAAIAALQAGDKANDALFTANRAVLTQTQAVDRWVEFQGDSVKKEQQRALITLLRQVGGSPAQLQAAEQDIQRRQATQDRLRAEATAQTQETERLNRESADLLRQHQRFALGVTLFQVAIGLSAIAALLRLPVVWWVSLASGGWASAVLLTGFLQR